MGFSLPHTLCIHIIHQTATRRETKRKKKTLYTYCILDMKNRIEPRAIFNSYRNVAASYFSLFFKFNFFYYVIIMSLFLDVSDVFRLSADGEKFN